MGRPKKRICLCGHSIDWHENGDGRCVYGHDTATRGCTCLHYHTRRTKDLGSTTMNTGTRSHVDDAFDALRKAIDAALVDFQRTMSPVWTRGLTTVPSMFAPAPTKRLEAPKVERREAHPLTRCESVILAVLKSRPKGASKVQLALLSGYRATSGSFMQACATLMKHGLMLSTKQHDKTIHILSEKGRQCVGHVRAPEQPLDMWLGKLKQGERNVLIRIIDAHPHKIDKDELSVKTGYSQTSGSFMQALANLRKLELIEGYDEMGISEAFQGEIKR